MNITKRYGRMIVALSASILVSGCATPVVAEAPKTSDVDAALAQSANKIASAENDLLAIAASLHPRPATGSIPSGGPQITLHYSGPLSIAVKSVADKMGYHVNESGTRIREIMVSVDVNAMSAFSVLNLIGDQAGESAGLDVHPENKTIFIVYGKS